VRPKADIAIPAITRRKSRDGTTRLIRIEGKNMAKVQRFPYERVT
jgi:hypothetical protein